VHPRRRFKRGVCTTDQRLNHPRRCTARRQRDGKPCGRFAIRGGTVCHIHGGASPQAQRKAKQRMDFAKAIMLERAVRGVAPDPRVSPADKRLAKVVAKRAGKPIRRAAKRPAGPHKPAEPAPAPEHPAETAVARPDSPLAVRTAPERPRALRPHFAEPTKPPNAGLTTAEDSVADIAAANRRARVSTHQPQKAFGTLARGAISGGGRLWGAAETSTGAACLNGISNSEEVLDRSAATEVVGVMTHRWISSGQPTFYRGDQGSSFFLLPPPF
jgi:hypothetical protein